MLLLVILALLAMFALVAVAFVVITGHAMRSARAVQRIGQYDERAAEDLQAAARQALRGSHSPGSVLKSLGLLEDMYGQVPIPGFDDDGDGQLDESDEVYWYHYKVSALDAAVCGGQLIEMAVPGGARRLGCVLTMLTGPAAGQSTRIVGINPSTGHCQMLGFQAATPVAGDECFINGTPFSGTGFGFNPGTGQLDTVVGTWPLALLPNHPLNANPPGGANEDYDAVDFQNPLLAARIVEPGTGRVITIPSLHRPALIRYWMQRVGATRWGDLVSAQGDLARMISLRPIQHPDFHPDFTGSNPNFNPAWDGTAAGAGSWDVDNDGDGIPDGVWVDLGLPVRSTADGRLYKPLFSFLCLDMDGRLNLNAHGCLAQADPTGETGPGGGPNGTADYYDPAALGGNLRFAGGANVAALPRGQGCGPAEVNLVALFDSATPPTLQAIVRYYRPLLLGNGALDGRWGETGAAAVGPGRAGLDDPLSHNKGCQFCDVSGYYPPDWNYWRFLANPAGYKPNGYGTPLDLNGNGFLGLDFAGRPLYWRMAEPNEQVDDPYETDLSPGCAHGLTSPAPIDNPFSAAELERLLRPFDRDAGRLPNRLALLTSTTGDPRDSVLLPHRHEITTQSWSLPCPAVALPKALRDELLRLGQRPSHVTDLLRAKGVPQAVWKDLLPPEVLAGLKMDLNRPFGNGRDDNGNGVVDEPGEANEQLTLYTTPGSTGAVPFRYGPYATVANGLAARQLHARHLYVLLLLLADVDYLRSRLGSEEEAARALAQWAVNAVDFRDRDSIMTPFPFDPDPFDAGGWNAPVGYPPADWDARFVVWGCERPELLISEAVAFHDRRTEDLEEPENRTDDPDDPDDDFDQKRQPEGSLFIELFNPWTAMEPPAGELYNASAPANQRGVVLTRTTANGHPVWRLIVVEPEEDAQNAGEQADPDDPLRTHRPEILRSIYFVDLSDSTFNDPGDGQSYHPSNPSTIAPVGSGRYVVVGPGDRNAAGPDYPTSIGERSDGQPLSETRRIVLTPSVNPNTMQVEVLQNKNGAATDLPIAAIKPAAAAVIDRPRRLSISEPVDGYPAQDPNGEPYDEASGGYPTPYDQPLDAASDLADLLLKTATTAGARIVHLQRLANPLLPYDPEDNPYRTIDSMPIDLTAFNGITSESDPNDAGGEVMFHTRQRGEREHATTADINNLWKQEPIARSVQGDADGPAMANHYFKKPFEHTLGYLNGPFGDPYPGSGPTDPYRGDPQRAFPWLTWNNRPLVSHLELLLVPALRSSKLLVCNQTNPWKYFEITRAGTPAEPYGPSAPQNVPYPHLMNFFQSQKKGDAAHSSPQFHRLLEYVRIPSRYVGTEVQANPTALTAGNHAFHPPFNRISCYREPGRINLNTIFSERVFRGLMNYFPGMSGPTFWRKFVQSRAGYGDGTSIVAIHSNYPTRFVRPFRSFAGGPMVPLEGMQPEREIDATLLRPDPADSTRPLFHYDHAAAPPAAYPDDTDRNPYFRYQGLQRLGNLVTTRSNVYAIWITVGYFEVEPNPGGVDAAHPDGYRLGPELGIDTGQVRRHRAFYLIDRSIPVGFRRGEDLNVEKAVLVGRFIE